MSTSGFSQQERAAMQARAAELRAEAEGGMKGRKAAADEADVLTKISDMDDADRPTVGFTPEAQLDDDSGLWPTSYAVTELTGAAEEAIGALVRSVVR